MPRFVIRSATRFLHHVVAPLSGLALGSASLIQAQDTRVRIATPTPVRSVMIQPRAYTLTASRATDRAVLGVTMSSSGKADTAGVRIDEVDANGPAAKAGIKIGDVIQEINGVSLRVSVSDVDDGEMGGVGQRRLQRVMAKAKVGDEIDLRVSTNGASRSVKVKPVSAAELATGSTRLVSHFSARSNDSQGSIGVAISSAGTVRDTLGLFVSSVVASGPAEKAGVVEGDRIAAVNGIDVRVPKEDVEDAAVSGSRINRFAREVQKVAPGGTVSLRVYSGGRYRDVSVPVVRSSELPASMHFNFMDGSGGGVRILRGGREGASTLDEMLPEGMNRIKLDSLMSRLRSRLREIEPSEAHVLPRRAVTVQKGADGLD